MSNHLYDGVFAPHADSTKTFLYTADRDISFAEFTALTDRIAAMLVAQGLAPGDRVAVQADKSVLLFALYAATVKAGGVYLPLNTGYTPPELDYFGGPGRPRAIGGPWVPIFQYSFNTSRGGAPHPPGPPLY